MATVPSKYQPEPRKWEDKEWLYEQYWGEMKSSADIARECDVCCKTIREKMAALGIPRRRDTWVRDVTDPLDGFRPDETTAVTVDWTDMGTGKAD